MPYRDFDAELPALDLLGPAATFKLGGQTWKTKPREGIPAYLVDLFAAGQEGVGVKLKTLFDAILDPADRDRFNEMFSAPDSPFSYEMLQPVFQFLVENVLARPTQPPPASPDGLASIGATSAVDSSWPGTPGAAN